MKKFKLFIIVFLLICFNFSIISPVSAESVPGKKVSGTVYDSITGKPISMVTIAVSHSSIFSQTDSNGKFTLDLWSHDIGEVLEIYAMKNFYKPSVIVKVAVGNTIDFKLNPEKVSTKGMTLSNPAVKYAKGTTSVKGKVIDKKTKKGVAGITVAFANSSVYAKTDFQGNFNTGWSGSGKTNRVYLISSKLDFPEEKNYYQIDTVSGYTAEVNFEITLK